MLKIEVGRGSGFENCEVHYMEYGNNCFMGFKIDGDFVTVYEHREILAAELEELLSQVKRGLDPSRMVKSDKRPSPVETVQHFQQSPTLAEIAPDVQKLLGVVNDMTMVMQTIPMAELVNDGEAAWGAKSKIAKVLGVPCAGSYLARIDHVLAQIISTTTLNTSDEGGLCA